MHRVVEHLVRLFHPSPGFEPKVAVAHLELQSRPVERRCEPYDLQRRLAAIEGRISGKARDGWRKIVGAARNDHHFAKAMHVGAKWRKKADREKC